MVALFVHGRNGLFLSSSFYLPPSPNAVPGFGRLIFLKFRFDESAIHRACAMCGRLGWAWCVLEKDIRELCWMFFQNCFIGKILNSFSLGGRCNIFFFSHRWSSQYSQKWSVSKWSLIISNLIIDHFEIDHLFSVFFSWGLHMNSDTWVWTMVTFLF